GELAGGDMARVDDMARLILGRGPHIDDRRTCVRKQHGIIGRDQARAARAQTDLDHERENEQNRGRSDQVRMIRGVLEQPIHWMCLIKMYRTVRVAWAAPNDSKT